MDACCGEGIREERLLADARNLSRDVPNSTKVRQEKIRKNPERDHFKTLKRETQDGNKICLQFPKIAGIPGNAAVI